MERLVDDVLTYSRAGSTHSEAEVVQVSELLQYVIVILMPPETFTIRVQEPMPVLKTFKAPLQQIFSNLIGNSIEHHDRPDGRVEILAKDLGGFCEFTVADDGPGIAPEFHKRIFKKFQTLQSPCKVEGTGMGLALVKKLVEQQGGKVTLESAPGKGASFSFTWPKQVEAEGP